MKTLPSLLLLIISITLFCSCEKEKAKPESFLPQSYFDYEDFVTDGLVAYFPFNGNCDDSTGELVNIIGNNLTYTSDRFNKPGGACYFDGNGSYICIENNSLLNGNAYTICFWYRSDLGDTLLQSILSKSDSLGYGYTIDVINSEHFSYPSFTFRTKHLLFEGRHSIGPLSQFWSLGSEQKYEFLAVAFSETDFVAYLRGGEGHNSPAIYFNANQQNLYIGTSTNNKYKKYKGELDDLLIYNRILSYEEIKRLSKWNFED